MRNLGMGEHLDIKLALGQDQCFELQFICMPTASPDPSQEDLTTQHHLHQIQTQASQKLETWPRASE